MHVYSESTWKSKASLISGDALKVLKDMSDAYTKKHLSESEVHFRIILMKWHGNINSFLLVSIPGYRT